MYYVTINFGNIRSYSIQWWMKRVLCLCRISGKTGSYSFSSQFQRILRISVRFSPRFAELGWNHPQIASLDPTGTFGCVTKFLFPSHSCLSFLLPILFSFPSHVSSSSLINHCRSNCLIV